jgi:hypothetical protein
VGHQDWVLGDFQPSLRDWIRFLNLPRTGSWATVNQSCGTKFGKIPQFIDVVDGLRCVRENLRVCRMGEDTQDYVQGNFQPSFQGLSLEMSVSHADSKATGCESGLHG